MDTSIISVQESRQPNINAWLDSNKWFPLSIRERKGQQSKKAVPLPKELLVSDPKTGKELATQPCSRFNAMMTITKNHLYV